MEKIKINKIAILSLIVIALITIGAIFIPMFWKYDYKKQNLELANIPDVMKVYPLDNGKNIYVTPQYTVVVVDKKGNLEGLAEVKNKDVNGKKKISSWSETVKSVLIIVFIQMQAKSIRN